MRSNVLMSSSWASSDPLRGRRALSVVVVTRTQKSGNKMKQRFLLRNEVVGKLIAWGEGVEC